MEVEKNELKELDIIVDYADAVAVRDDDKARIVATLKPISETLAGYTRLAETITVTNHKEAADAAQIVAEIKQKRVSAVNCLTARIDLLHKTHRAWTAFRSMFTDPLDKSENTIRTKIVTWQKDEERKAAELQRKLQAEADERERKEREKAEAAIRLQREKEAAALAEQQRQERLAAQAKNEAQRQKAQAAAEEARKQAAQAAAKAEVKEEAAAAVQVAPKIIIEAQKAINTRKSIKVKDIDLGVFLVAAARDPNLRGFITINENGLIRSKAANKMLEIPGVVFEEVVR